MQILTVIINLCVYLVCYHTLLCLLKNHGASTAKYYATGTLTLKIIAGRSEEEEEPNGR